MKLIGVLAAFALLVPGGVFLSAAHERGPGHEPRCKSVHADLVEDGVTAGCKPGHPSCFLGEVDGNRGFRGTTYFRADSAATGPATSPGFISYSGIFEYTIEGGILTMRETGVVDPTVGRPSSGAVTAYQEVISSTGELSGVTGYLFVSGFSRSGHVVTRVMGRICYPE